jgi:hypothetical protein
MVLKRDIIQYFFYFVPFLFESYCYVVCLAHLMFDTESSQP